MNQESIKKAAEAIKNARYGIAFTGAGISVESGVPPFRGSANSVWAKYDPQLLDIDYFYAHPAESWKAINEIFLNFMFKHEIHPNTAHYALAEYERLGYVKCVITQNIDILHQQAGSRNVYEYHGTAGRIRCTKCDFTTTPDKIDLAALPPKCPKCGALLKPDFIFFGEGIPAEAYQGSASAAMQADVCIVVGTTGEVMPAGMIPITVKRHGGTIIEVNPTHSAFTDSVTDIYLDGKAGEVFEALNKELGVTISK
ncbi:MAG: NAD-dependent deacylase [Bacteroidales bacterium]|nr:NAD-dependent deacylase [Bacteroidales bacterium]